MQQVHIFISGQVQGVGYRMFVKKHAERLGLTGWVKNLPDSRVEAVVQGQREAIEELLTLCKKGPFLAEVKSVESIWEEREVEYRSFVIHH